MIKQLKYLSLSHTKVYYYSLVFLAMSLPLSVFTTTLAEIILVINWLWEGNLKNKFIRLHQRKSAVLLMAIYAVHLIGMIYTNDFDYGIHDLKIKLPVLVLPLIISTSSVLNIKQLRDLLLCFSFAVLVSTLVSVAVLFGLINIQVLDYRDISIFISHIRLALMVDLAIFSLLYFIISHPKDSSFNLRHRILFIAVIIWFFIFLFLLKSITGLFILITTGVILGWIFTGKIHEIAPRFIIRVLLISIPLIILTYLSHSVDRYFQRDELAVDELEKYTLMGNSYNHDMENKAVENGHYIYLYICEEELRKGWNQISKYDFDGKDKKEQLLKFTLYRYLTSKDLRKDFEGLNKLTDKEIEAIENGMTNYIFLNKFGIYPRIYEIIWEIDSFEKGENPSGHSVTQRIFYFRAAKEMIFENPVFGVGTGDLKNEYDKYYDNSGSIIEEKWRYRAHNQYLTFTITFGIFGFLIIMGALILPAFLEKKWKDYFYLCFALIGFISMLTEDTLETQTGVSFFMFFYSLFLFGWSNEEN